MPFIVGYHRVVENFENASRNSIPSMLISSAMMERHIECLAKRFEFVSLDEIGSRLESKGRFRRPAAAITFDDGYGDVYRYAFPILKRKGIPAAVFVVTGLMGTAQVPIHDRLYLMLTRAHQRGLPLKEIILRLLDPCAVGRLNVLQGVQQEPFQTMTLLLDRFSYDEIQDLVEKLQAQMPVEREVLDEMAPLDWEMIKEMHRSGMTIGSHTRSHTLLTHEQIVRAKSELAESRMELERRLNAHVHHFAYPDGRFNRAVVEAVQDAGYRYGYGICQSRDSRLPLLTIPRKILWEGACLNALGQFSPAIMDCQINWAFDQPGRCDHDHTPLRTGVRGSLSDVGEHKSAGNETVTVQLKALSGLGKYGRG
jgi:peptidoglycan/xylan/chitin deacetylase (PgdA/CDA1 family)